MLTLAISRTTTIEELDSAISYPDMHREAMDRAIEANQSLDPKDLVVLEVHRLGDVTVLMSHNGAYAMVNEYPERGPSLIVHGCLSPEQALAEWRSQ